ncbi:hypothetical protein ACTWP5_23310 [Streptomyces sp. 4N509B]|uniref:hypothetical protein n=1 Tax=Streptomyces sp. 4N509B TaxID=3457413 RepID=UPI003FD511C7
MSAADRSALPPVRLPSEDELARAALATPLLSRAVELARWAAEGVPVGADGALASAELTGAVGRLGLAEPDGHAEAVEAWDFAVDAGLVTITETGEEGRRAAADGPAGVARPGRDLAVFGQDAAGSHAVAVLDVWSEGVDGALAAAALAGSIDPRDPEREPDPLEAELDAPGMDENVAEAELADLSELDWDPEEETELLDAALATLYLFTAADEEVGAGAMVPLPMLAAAVVMPEGVTEDLSDEDLDDMTTVVISLDEQLRALEGTGLVEYVPADPDADPGDVAVSHPEDEEAADLASFGQVRLTSLGLYGVRRRMREGGLEAPVVGELRDGEAGALLAAIPYRPEPAAREEAELWLAGRDPLDASRQLLAAARGADPEAPGRRLACQLVLSLVDERSEEALREVLDDAELGGLARVWLAERGAEVPAPSEEMVFWLTVDTLAAQLGTAAEHEDAVELRELVRDLTSQHSAFFDKAWRCDHPATADVLEAMGRFHPDRQLAKQARKAAFKARSRA